MGVSSMAVGSAAGATTGAGAALGAVSTSSGVVATP